MTFRDSELTPEHPLTDTLATLRRADGPVTRLALGGLDEYELRELLHAVSGQEVGADTLALAGMLERDTNGNPLFVSEVLSGLLEGGHVTLDDQGHWRLAVISTRSRRPPVFGKWSVSGCSAWAPTLHACSRQRR